MTIKASFAGVGTREVSLQFSALAMAPWVITPLGHGTLTAFDVYHDLATSDFGMNGTTAMELALLMSKYDSFNQLQQRPNDGTHSDPRMNGGGGCSGYSANNAMTANESLSYFGYVDEIAAFEDKITSPADHARFDYWLSIYKFGRAEARSWALWGEFDKALTAAERMSGIGCKPNPASLCYQDTPSRILTTTIAISDPTNTMESCAASCAAAKLKLAGVEYGASRPLSLPGLQCRHFRQSEMTGFCSVGVLLRRRSSAWVASARCERVRRYEVRWRQRRDLWWQFRAQGLQLLLPCTKTNSKAGTPMLPFSMSPCRCDLCLCL